MSRVTDFLEQDVGGGEGDGLPTYENLAQTHGPNSRYGHSSMSRFIALNLSRLVQVRKVERLGREEVILITRLRSNSLSLFQRAAERYANITPDELDRRRRRGWGEGTTDVVRAPFLYLLLIPSWSTNLRRLFLKMVPQRHQRLGLRLSPNLCICALTWIVTPSQAHQFSQTGSLNMIPRTR
jgi:hypothetical protein